MAEQVAFFRFDAAIEAPLVGAAPVPEVCPEATAKAA